MPSIFTWNETSFSYRRTLMYVDVWVQVGVITHRHTAQAWSVLKKHTHTHTETEQGQDHWHTSTHTNRFKRHTRWTQSYTWSRTIFSFQHPHSQLFPVFSQISASIYTTTSAKLHGWNHAAVMQSVQTQVNCVSVLYYCNLLYVVNQGGSQKQMITGTSTSSPQFCFASYSCLILSV